MQCLCWLPLLAKQLRLSRQARRAATGSDISHYISAASVAAGIAAATRGLPGCCLPAPHRECRDCGARARTFQRVFGHSRAYARAQAWRARVLARGGCSKEPRGIAALRPSDHQLQIAGPNLPKCALLRGSPWRWSGALLPMFCMRAKQYQFSRLWSDLQRGARVCAEISVSQHSWQSLRFRMRRVVGPMPCALAARPAPRSRSTSARAPQSPCVRTTLGAGHASKAD